MSLTQLVLYVLMILAALAMLWANQKFNREGVVWGRPLAAVCGILACGLAIAAIVVQIMAPGSQIRSIQEREMEYSRIGMIKFGQWIAEHHAGSKAIIVTNEENEGNRAQMEARYKALEEGLGNKVTITSVARMRPMEEMEMMGEPDAPKPDPKSFLTAENFDSLARASRDANLIICLLGLPMDYDKMKFWTWKGDERQKLALFNVPNLGDPAIQKAVTADYISVILSIHPEAKYDPKAKIPKDQTEAFNSRYILIDKANIKDLIGKYPAMFGK